MDDKSDAFWTVNVNGNRKVVTATDKKEDAAIFYIETRECSDKFAICYKGEQFNSKKRKRECKYIKMKSRVTKLDEGPVKIGSSNPAYFTLRHPVMKTKKEVSSVDSWVRVQKSCYIKLESGMLKKKCYVAFNINGTSSQSMCADCIEKGEEMGLSMRFKLTHVKIEHYRRQSDSIATTPRSASGGSKSFFEGMRRTKCDGDDDDDVATRTTRRIVCDGGSRVQCDAGDLEDDAITSASTLEQFEADCKGLSRMHYGVEVEEDSDEGEEDCCSGDEGDDSGQEDLCCSWEDEEADSDPEDQGV